jgi:hypothetical protein
LTVGERSTITSWYEPKEIAKDENLPKYNLMEFAKIGSIEALKTN